MYKVYCWTNKVNGKKYVGLTCQSMSKRAGSHMHGYEQVPYFWHAIQKYGEDSFTCEILEDDLTLEVAEQKEIYYIDLYKTRDRDCGYNIEKGGTHNQSEETRRKQSERTKEALSKSPKMEKYKAVLKIKNRERATDPKNRAAISKGLKTMWQDPEIKEKRIKTIKSVWSDPAMKARILAARKATGKQCGPYKPVSIYCKEKNTTYDTVAEAENALGVGIRTTMRRSIKRGVDTFEVGSRKGVKYTLTRIS